MFDELNISKKLMKNEQILNAYERGLVNYYISMKTLGAYDEEIIDNRISLEQCELWSEKYSIEIEQAQQKIKDDEKHATRHLSHPLVSGMINIMSQNPNKDNPISEDVLGKDIEMIVIKTQEGDTRALLTVLTTNVLQLQLFNGTITQNIMGDAGKQLDNFEKLSSMQIKVMQETRKSIMAINEIANPKRTTFIKEASQHNHLHQKVLEKKVENENELQKTEQLEAPAVIEDAEIIPLKDKVK